MEQLKSFLKYHIPNFIKYKKSLGYKYDNINHLYLIDKIFYDNNIQSFNEIDKIQNLINNDNKLKRYRNDVNNLIKFNNIIENKSEENKIIIPKISKTPNKVPHIITKEEFNILCNYIDNTSYKNNYNKIISVLIRLLYSTGMRINEALSLKMGDIDQLEGKIIIRNSKNNKSRIIVISNTMKNVLNKYISLFHPENYLFEYNKKKIIYYNASNYFKRITKELNLKVSFHDLRHTMATTSLLNLLKDGYDEKEILYYLHIYLGHSTIEETEYYLYFTKSIKDNMRLDYESK